MGVEEMGTSVKGSLRQPRCCHSSGAVTHSLLRSSSRAVNVRRSTVILPRQEYTAVVTTDDGPR
jgi:hypothetical protein